ncbi:abscisic stress-ripening protein 1-like [Cryptomeria japonica]|uniref:abscisic stress-ripening protein 1-like n=1 Tax=Cryptomeria japonica TaxID=3369 RepID=UPI0025AD5CFA|nr:abscisic stress-ripening protein 1-like [Cryptomeria japonica]
MATKKGATHMLHRHHHQELILNQWGLITPPAEEEAKKHKHREHMAEMGALATGAFALYEGHEAKVDPQHAGRHKMEAEIAGAAAVGAGF